MTPILFATPVLVVFFMLNFSFYQKAQVENAEDLRLLPTSDQLTWLRLALGTSVLNFFFTILGFFENTQILLPYVLLATGVLYLVLILINNKFIFWNKILFFELLICAYILYVVYIQ